ncbi:MAG: hypothetical protein A2176_11990 [Spirochaetes bacterium RBG_13_51_14]|nr:MAG: hypothetical protein A2176_11990 [Spirochaetes bacterium RBG_13_51_14]
MKKALSLACILYLTAPSLLIPQGTIAAAPANEVGRSDSDGKAEDKKDDEIRNVNIDALMLYGQYNRILWTGSLTQSFEAFTYQLKSDFNRSNDFGYKNSRYYENEIGFTGGADCTDKWKLTPVLEVNNESHGLFRNPFYTREEKDRVELELKSEYRPMPARWNFNIGGVYFIHRLDSSLYPDIYPVRPYHGSDFYRANAEIGWEYILSAANKFSFNSKFSQYFYSTSSDNDTFVANEFIWNFNVSEYLKFGMGPLYAYNRDGGHFVSGKIDVTTVNIKYVSVGASYTYELVPFIPEEFYFDQRYVKPSYSLSPGRGHHAAVTIGIDATTVSSKKFYLKKIKITSTGSFITNDRYYSYFSLPSLVLAPHQMKIAQAKAQGEAAIGLSVLAAYCELGGRYEYSYFYATDYVTYRPGHQVGGYLRLAVHRFEAEFSTAFRGSMQTSPFMKNTIRPALSGSLSLQFKVYESFFLYGRIDNIYNSRISTVYGYPVQGRTIMGGLRIII